jgi:hypothetical protein
VVIAIVAAVPLLGLCGLYCIDRLVGDPGWGYRVRGMVRQADAGADDLVFSETVGITTNVSADLFASRLLVHWSITNRRDVTRKSGSKDDLGRALSLLVAEGKLTKKGDRRKTTYTVK